MLDDATVREVINQVVDPCSASIGIPIGLVDLGLVRSVEVDNAADRPDVIVRLRLTSPGCMFAARVRGGNPPATPSRRRRMRHRDLRRRLRLDPRRHRRTGPGTAAGAPGRCANRKAPPGMSGNRTTDPRTSVAERYLALLSEKHIRHLFVNAGTDFAPIVEAYARAGRDRNYPRPILAGHENLATGMAHGAYLMTGEPQVVMVHVSVGTANAHCAVINAARERVPLIVTAGRSPILEQGAIGSRDTFYQWAQEMYDQPGMLGEFVKWRYELRDSSQIAHVVERAFSQATSEPKGPVYLDLPREVLAAPLPGDGEVGTVAPATGGHPDPRAVAALADRLADAELPVIVTSAAGADPAAATLLGDLCERFAIGVVEIAPRYFHVPADHPYRLGAADPIVSQADVVVSLECEVPWIPKLGAPDPAAFVAQVGSDPLFAALPMRSHRSDLTVTAPAASFLRALDAALDSRRERLNWSRAAGLAERADAARLALTAATDADRGKTGSITRTFIGSALAEQLDDEVVIFNEYPLVPEQMGRRRPRTYFYVPAAGGLGWGLPAALGAKLAAPERTVVAAVGDGSYFFANPAACHHASRKHDLPVLTIVANNASWAAVDWSTRSVYPDGVAVRTGYADLSDLSPMPDFEEYVRSSGGHGERVAKRDELQPALERALHAVQVEGRQALVNIECE